MDIAKPPNWLKGLGRHLKRCGWFWAIAVLLLLISQVLWLWESWPVRQLLDREQARVGSMR